MGNGQVIFDDYFKGATDSEKVRSLNEWANTHGGKPTPTVVWDARVYSITEPIGLTSGLRMIGGAGSAAREYGRTTSIRYSGPPGSSLFRFGVVQTNQGYPKDGSPRDIFVAGIEFRGGASVDFMPSVSPGEPSTGRVSWYNEFRDCGWNGFRRVWWGYVDGGGITGTSHFQAFSDTALWPFGSEWVLGGSFPTFMDSQALPAGKPMIRTSLSKSHLGRIMVTTRKGLLALHVDGGHGTRFLELDCDARDSDPTYGCAVRITGNPTDHVFGDSTYKGHMTNPAAAIGGVAQNRGIIHVEGGRHLLFERDVFERRGNSVPAPATPLIFVGPKAGAETVKVGLNSFAGYDGVVQQSLPGQIVALDPTLQVVTAA